MLNILKYLIDEKKKGVNFSRVKLLVKEKNSIF